MTEMSSLSVTRCSECHFWNILLGKIGYCYNPNSHHFGHVILSVHPICTVYRQREEQK